MLHGEDCRRTLDAECWNEAMELNPVVILWMMDLMERQDTWVINGKQWDICGMLLAGAGAENSSEALVMEVCSHLWNWGSFRWNKGSRRATQKVCAQEVYLLIALTVYTWLHYRHWTTTAEPGEKDPSQSSSLHSWYCTGRRASTRVITQKF